MKVYENLRLAASRQRVYCPNCSQANPAENEVCDECNSELMHPSGIFPTLLEIIIRPFVGMRRVAATAPLVPAFFMVVLTTSIQFVIEVLSVYQFWLYYYNNPTKVTDPFIKNLTEGKLTGTAPEPWQFFLALLIFLVSWGLFTGALYLTGRLFYRKDAILHYDALLSVVAFARTGYIGLLVLLVLLLLIPDAAGVGSFLALLPLVWQLSLLVIGVRTSTGLNWNRAAIMVMIPAVFFIFLLPALIGVQIPF